jgi:hypothetical protein
LFFGVENTVILRKMTASIGKKRSVSNYVKKAFAFESVQNAFKMHSKTIRNRSRLRKKLRKMSLFCRIPTDKSEPEELATDDFFSVTNMNWIASAGKKWFETITTQCQTITHEILTCLYAPSSEPLNVWMAAAHLCEQSYAFCGLGHPCPHTPLRAVPTLVTAWRRALVQLWPFPRCSWRLWTRAPFRNV